jgi:hypothetical protein
MVTTAQKERERFRIALNARIAIEHPPEHGRAQWLHERLTAYMKRNGIKRKPVSPQTCGYWVRGEKIAGPANATILCGALGMTRGDLFGDTEDPDLAKVVENWSDLPGHIKHAILSLVDPAASRQTPPPQSPRKTA